MGRRKAAASRKARARIAPLTATGTVQDITAIVRDRADDRELAQQDAEKGELLEILGLAEQLNKPIPPSAEERDAWPCHYLGLQDASVLATRDLLLTGRAVADLIESEAMGAVVGPAGLGKTFAITEIAVLCAQHLDESMIDELKAHVCRRLGIAVALIYGRAPRGRPTAVTAIQRSIIGLM
jgi:hypothetical protein